MGTILSWISRCHVFTGERLGFASGIAWCSGPNIGSETERRCHRPLVDNPIVYPSAALSKTLGGTLLLGLLFAMFRFTEAPLITAVGRQFRSRETHGRCRANQTVGDVPSQQTSAKREWNEGGRDCLLCPDHLHLSIRSDLLSSWPGITRRSSQPVTSLSGGGARRGRLDRDSHRRKPSLVLSTASSSSPRKPRCSPHPCQRDGSRRRARA
ncbi:unnamed protein product [Musa acuminata var. zebrina]